MSNRVLSYQLAQTLTADDLQQVSGGEGHQTSYFSGHITTATGQMDGGVDVTWDI